MNQLTQEQLLLLTTSQLRSAITSRWSRAVILHTVDTFYPGDGSQQRCRCIDRVEYKKWKFHFIIWRGLSNGDPNNVGIGVAQPDRSYTRRVLRKKLKPLLKYRCPRGVFRNDSVMVRMVVSEYNAATSDRIGLVLCYLVMQLLEQHDALETGEFPDPPTAKT